MRGTEIAADPDPVVAVAAEQDMADADTQERVIPALAEESAGAPGRADPVVAVATGQKMKLPFAPSQSLPSPPSRLLLIPAGNKQAVVAGPAIQRIELPFACN